MRKIFSVLCILPAIFFLLQLILKTVPLVGSLNEYNGQYTVTLTNWVTRYHVDTMVTAALFITLLALFVIGVYTVVFGGEKKLVEETAKNEDKIDQTSL
jgi:hypothetical protein